MPNLDDYNVSARLRLLVFGKFKTGKTAGAATFPRPNFLQFDGGLATLKNPELEAKYGYSKRGIMYEGFIERDIGAKGVVNTHNAFDDACRYFDACNDVKVTKYVSPTNGKTYELSSEMFDTWVIDSGTTLSAMAKNKALVLMGTKEFAGKALSQTHAAAVKTGLIVPKKQDFGAERSLVEQFIDMVAATDKHLVLLCHEKEQWVGEGAEAHIEAITPMFTGQSAETIPLKFDEIYNLRVKKEGTSTKRYLQTAPDSIRACGTRLGLPDGTPFEFDAIKQALKL